MLVGDDLDAAEAFAEQVIFAFMSQVRPASEASVQLAHPWRKSAVWNRDDYVIVRGHQTPGVDPPVVFPFAAIEHHQEHRVVGGIEEDSAATVPTRAGVEETTRVRVPRRTGHLLRMQP